MNFWEVAVRLIDNNFDTVLDVAACQPGCKTRWISNFMPELHEEGEENTSHWYSFLRYIA